LSRKILEKFIKSMRGMKGYTDIVFSNGKNYAIIWIQAFNFVSKTRNLRWKEDRGDIDG